MSGWIKLYRKFQDWEWYSDSQAVHLFIHILLSANNKDKNWRGKKIRRGEFVTTVKNLSEKTKVPVSSVRRRLKVLEDSGVISVKTTNKFSVITICKYEDYQASEQTSEQTSEQQLKNIRKKEYKKENIVVDHRAYVRACEEDFIGQMKTDESWLEIVCMRYHLSRDDIMDRLDTFNLDLQCAGKRHTDIRDAKSHFASWLRLALKDEQDAKRQTKSRLPIGMALDTSKMNYDKSKDWG